MTELISLADIEAAAERLYGVAQHTPVVKSRMLNERVGREIFLKCEQFQRAGAFKFRGAYNMVAQLGQQARERGVIAFSSGNHAQGLALAAHLRPARHGVRGWQFLGRHLPVQHRCGCQRHQPL